MDSSTDPAPLLPPPRPASEDAATASSSERALRWISWGVITLIVGLILGMGIYRESRRGVASSVSDGLTSPSLELKSAGRYAVVRTRWPRG